MWIEYCSDPLLFIIILLFIFILNIGDDKVKREQECEESGLEAETGELDLSRPRTSSGAVIMSSSSTTTISSSATASCTAGSSTSGSTSSTSGIGSMTSSESDDLGSDCSPVSPPIPQG